MFLSFKAIKAKKAARVAIKTKLQTGKFVDSEILSNHLVRCFNVPFVHIWIPDSKYGISKAKTYLKGHKIARKSRDQKEQANPEILKTHRDTWGSEKEFKEDVEKNPTVVADKVAGFRILILNGNRAKNLGADCININSPKQNPTKQ